jgi:uncharacterized lipoprotein YmbA
MTPKNLTRPRWLAPCAAVAALGILAACNVVPPPSDDPTRFFVLSDPASAAAPAPAPGAVRVGLRAIRLESYLRRKEMVVRTGANEVEFRDYRRWAEPLDAAVGRVLRLRLLEEPGVAQVLVDPFPVDQEHDYDVAVDVRRCEGTADASGKDAANFSAMIEITTAGPGAHVVARKLFTAPAAAWDGRDYGQLASLLSADIAALGQEVASDLPPKG